MKKNLKLRLGLLAGLLVTLASAGGCLPAGGEEPTGGFDWTIIIFLVLIFAVFYFLMIRPQRKRQKEHQHMTQELQSGDNVVTILTTVRNMTQPEIMAMANNALGAIQEVPPESETPSVLTLLRELSNPRTRRGMARMISLLQILDEEPVKSNTNK